MGQHAKNARSSPGGKAMTDRRIHYQTELYNTLAKYFYGFCVGVIIGYVLKMLEY
jgi:hypothetical protein